MFGFLKGGRARDVERAVSPLEGIYDIRGDVLFGAVEKAAPFFSGLGMKVEALRGADVIASCDAVEVPGHTKMRFTLAFGGRFTVAELAREQVRLVARNERGDSGVLALDGATRVELIRDYMGVQVEPILNLDFAAGGNARPHLGVGWAGAEAMFTWAIDDVSVVNLPRDLTAGVYFARIVCGAFVTDFLRSQPMEIFLNEHPVGAFIDDSPAFQFREFRFELATDPAAGDFSLRFEHPGAARPSDLAATDDRRRLAFRFRSMSFVKAL